jgi:hypothetical protein
MVEIFILVVAALFVGLIIYRLSKRGISKKYDRKSYRERRRSSSSSQSRRYEKKYKDDKKGKYHNNDEDLK